MLKNYLRAALRNIKRKKIFSLINIIGMAVGMAGFAFFAHLAGVKLNSDKFHKNGKRIYSVIQVFSQENKENIHTAFSPGPLMTALMDEFPEIEKAVRVFPGGNIILKKDRDSFYEHNLLFVDPDFLNVFTFGLAAGDANTALTNPNSIILSESAAVKYFGKENPLGEVLTLAKKIPLTVTGISKNIPRTSSLRFEFLVSMETLRSLSPGIMENWNLNQHMTFLLLPEGVESTVIEQKLPMFMSKFISDSPDSPKKMYLFPFLDFRMKATHIDSILSSTHPAAVYIMFGIGTLLLLIVSINFINLSIARNMYRTKEVGLRKVIGASRFQLVRQFLGESILLAFISLPVAILFYELINPLINTLFKDISMFTMASKVSNSIWNYPFLLKYMVVAALLTGVFSGFYPALVLSAFRPAQILKGSIQTGRKKRHGTKLMIIFQFALAVLFIATAGLLKNQTNNIINANFGFNRERIAIVRIPAESRKKLETLKAEFKRHPDILTAAGSSGLPLDWSNQLPVMPVETTADESLTMESYGIDFDFIEVMDMEIKAGRSFSREKADNNNFILSEKAVEMFGWKTPIGQQIKVGENTGTVIGVVEDFIFTDIGFSLPPSLLYIDTDNSNFLFLKYSSSADFIQLNNDLKQTWQILFPDLPFTCLTLDGYFNMYTGILDKFFSFLNIFGLTAVLFSCLGLLGLAAHAIERRTKEIGIRKILGASTPKITWLVIREFMFLVVIGNAIAFALLYYGWHKVLQTGLLFIQNISFSTYASALFVSLSVACIAVISQTIKTTRRNPIETLRFE